MSSLRVYNKRFWEEKTKEQYKHIFPDVSNLIVKPPEYTACEHISVPSYHLSDESAKGYRHWAFETMEDLLIFSGYYWKRVYEVT